MQSRKQAVLDCLMSAGWFVSLVCHIVALCCKVSTRAVINPHYDSAVDGANQLYDRSRATLCLATNELLCEVGTTFRDNDGVACTDKADAQHRICRCRSSCSQAASTNRHPN